jgi:hypothetical protein
MYEINILLTKINLKIIKNHQRHDNFTTAFNDNLIQLK